MGFERYWKVCLVAHGRPLSQKRFNLVTTEKADFASSRPTESAFLFLLEYFFSKAPGVWTHNSTRASRRAKRLLLSALATKNEGTHRSEGRGEVCRLFDPLVDLRDEGKGAGELGRRQ